MKIHLHLSKKVLIILGFLALLLIGGVISGMKLRSDVRLGAGSSVFGGEITEYKPEEISESYCATVTGVNDHGDYFTSKKDSCFYTLVEGTSNTNVNNCYQLVDKSLASRCVAIIAARLHDRSLCATLPSSDSTREKTSLYQDSCFNQLAQALDDISVCQSIKTDFQHNECVNTRIQLHQNLKECQLLRGEVEQMNCAKYVQENAAR